MTRRGSRFRKPIRIRTAGQASSGTPSRHRPRRSRVGFTLLEVIVAMAISAVLIAAVYLALSLHMQRTEGGYEDVELAAVARGVLRQIAHDLQLASYQAGSGGSTTGGQNQNAGDGSGTSGGNTSNGASGSASQTGGSRTGNDTNASSSNERGLWGESGWVTFDVGASQGTLMRPSAGQAVQPSGGAQMLLYALDLRTSERSRGLLRRAMDRADVVDAGFDPEVLVDSAVAEEFLSAEILDLQLRYYDGLTWEEEWDSETDFGLPRAIEVSIRVGRPGDERPALHRLVVPLGATSVNALVEDALLWN